MKNKLRLLVGVILVSLHVTAQKIITKKILGKDNIQGQRELQIYLPEGYDKKENNSKNYPLAVVLDAEHMFDLYVANANLFAKTDKAPQQIIVGIKMDKKRKKDTDFNPVTNQLSETNVSFMNFLRDDVLPFIEGSYRTSPFITLAGQGTSANIITMFLKDREPLFNAFVCINSKFYPRMYEDVEGFNLSSLAANDNTYYYYINNNPTFKTVNISAINQVKEAMQGVTAENFNLKFDKTNAPDNVSSLSEAIPRAMTKVFELYSGISEEELKTKIEPLSPMEAITYLENKYLDIDFLFGSNLGIRERDIYAIEKLIIDKNDGIYLKTFGEMILNAYPKSHIGDYYVGLYYEKQKEMKQAIKHYKRAYGKMELSDPRTEMFYTNIERLNGR